MAPHPSSVSDDVEFTSGSFNFSSSPFSLPLIPSILSEWASILPLAFHLASAHEAYQILGEIALRGSVRYGLLPRLGFLQCVADLFYDDLGFIDSTSRGGAGSTVYDVNWGSVFPTANGGASDLLIQYAKGRATASPRHLPDPAMSPNTSFKPSKLSFPGFLSRLFFDRAVHDTQNDVKVWRRYQNLYIIKLNRDQTNSEQTRTRLFHYIRCLLVVVAAVFLFLVGAYGAAVVLLVPILTQILSLVTSSSIRRPPGYLANNEGTGGCMLVAPRENANVWCLFIGDRGVIDSVLNKPMVVSSTAHKTTFSSWLRVAHVLQLTAFTYVAAQKGFEGVFLVIAIILERAAENIEGGTRLVSRWLAESRVEMTVSAFRFTGRMPMVGVVQMMSDTTSSSWMDNIIAKSPRREAWLQKLECLRFHHPGCEKCRQESKNDEKWLELNTRLVVDGLSFVQRWMS